MSSKTDPIKVSLVGHCTPDSFALRSAISGFFPNAQVESIHSQGDFDQRLMEFDLHLINRVLDGDFMDTSGINLIRANASKHSALMLISNFPESLQEAVEAGGVPGFGKRDMRSENALVAMSNALGISANT